MKIGINGRHLGPNKTGVSRYLLSLLQEWQRAPRGHQFFVYTSTEKLEPEDEALFVSGSPIIHRRIPRPIGTNSFHLWYNWSMPRTMIRDGINWFFSPDYFCPPFFPRSIRRSMTLHDISFFTHPAWFPLVYRLSCELYSRRPAKHADLIFTISDFSKKEIINEYGIPSQHILITPLAAENKFSPGLYTPSPISEISGPFFLFVGKILNRRHIKEMLLAFKSYLRQQSDISTQFIIRGRDETHPAQDIKQLVSEINSEMDRAAVIMLDYCDDRQLIQLYRNTQAFFYLSTYEGFGLPVLEALACGTPTVTVKETSIPEVAGEAAVYVDPTNIGELRRVMSRLLTDTPWTSDLRCRSVAQARKFSWENTANATLRAIEKAYAK